jgi:RNA polymerase sigma-70 factor (ECF subfamily)
VTVIDHGGQSDGELIGRTLSGDPGAFDALVARHERRVYNVAYRILLSREDAEDAAVEAFVRMHRSLADFRRDAPFLPWALKITTNAALNLLRLRRPPPLRLDQPIDGEDDSIVLDLPDPRPGPEEQVRERIGVRELEREIDDLPEAFRIPFVLMYLEGLDCGGIADALGISVGATKTRLCRAREMLRQRLRMNAGSMEVNR